MDDSQQQEQQEQQEQQQQRSNPLSTNIPTTILPPQPPTPESRNSNETINPSRAASRNNDYYLTAADTPYSAPINWNLDMRDFLSSWAQPGDTFDAGGGVADIAGSDSSSGNVEQLFHNSFDIWGNLDDVVGLQGGELGFEWGPVDERVSE